MTYTALYRKYRPIRFNDVVGQVHIIKTLKNQLINNKISHAYLFCGTRGTGKTSVAKIFAKALNCLDLEDAEPCGKCDSCVEIAREQSANVIEIDAASNNGVDNIRELREEIKYTPASGRYKVYIVDEVHMLSTGAYNALLKTLEEPPAHAIFILATTDPQKIPATVHSRCQRFDFKRVSIDLMTPILLKYSSDEGINLLEEAADYISRLSDGSMRDALSLLDQSSLYASGDEITLNILMDITGSSSQEVFFDLTEALINYDSNTCLTILNESLENGRDLNRFASGLISHLRNLIVAGFMSSGDQLLDLGEQNIKRLKEQYLKLEFDLLLSFIDELTKSLSLMRNLEASRILFEITLLKICNPAQKNNLYSELLSRISKIEAQISNGFIETSKKKEPKETKPKTEKIVKPPPPTPSDIKDVIKNWNVVLDNIKKSKTPHIYGFLADAKPVCLNGISLTILFNDIVNAEVVKQKLQTISDVIQEHWGKNFQLDVKAIDKNKETASDSDIEELSSQIEEAFGHKENVFNKEE